jgi:acyl-coenzyme A thioesterase PaaI-like protein
MSDDPFAFNPARMFKAMRHHGHSGALGLDYRQHGPDWVELALPWNPELVGDVEAQTPASGAIIALLDMTAGMSVWTRLGLFRPQATLDLRVDYLRAAHPHSEIVARIECYRLASEVSFVRGIAHDGDPADPVAHMAASFMFVGPPMAPRGSPGNPVGANG